MRPRYGRVVAAAGALATTTVSALGGLGVIGTGPSAAQATAAGSASVSTASAPDGGSSPTDGAPQPQDGALEPQDGAPEPQALRPGTHLLPPWRPAETALPAASGQGRRVVFSESRQQVWLVGAGGKVQRTYLVTGSVYDNLEPGTYAVYSRSRHAVGVDDSGTMGYFVRFTTGDRAAIGFHDIPERDGDPVQSLGKLGTPLSHGCIRQRRADAVALWRFAPEGTTVVVTP